MKNFYIIKTTFLLLTVFLLTSCEPEGGDFVPIPQEGTILESFFDKENIVQVYDDEQLLLKIHGEWKSMAGIFYMNLEVVNQSQTDLKIEFKQLTIKSTFDKKIDFGNGIERKTSDSGWERTESSELKVASGKSELISIRSGMPELKGKYMPQSFYVGNKIYLDVPIRLEDFKQEKVYKFAFKYDYYQ